MTEPSPLPQISPDQPPASGASLRQQLAPWAWPATLTALFLLTITAFVPFQPDFFDSELDSSWVMALHWAWLKGMDFGHQVIFTYGPWGFFLQGFHPQTFKYAVIGPSIFAAGCFVALLQLSKHLTSRKWAQALWMLGLIALVGSPLHRELRTMCTAWLLVFLHFYHDDRPITWWKIVMIVALSLGSLGKFTIFVGVFPLLMLVTVDELFRKRVPWLLIIYLGCCLILWLAAGQSLSSIAPFLRNSLDLSNNHAQATGQRLPTEARDISLFVSGALLVMALAGLGHWVTFEKSRRAEFPFYFRGVLVLGGLAFMLFLAFKSGFVRHDVHEIAANDALFVLTVLVTTVFWRSLRYWMFKGPALGLIVWCGALSWHSDYVFTGIGLPSSVSQAITDLPGRSASAIGWLFGSTSVQQKYDEYMQQFRATRSIPPVSGTVDLYPYSARVVLANNLDYHPRPTLQSYVASYSNRLGQINAEFLRGPDAPQSILFELMPFDGHYPSQDDGVSWPELLTRYDLKDASRSALLLERSAQPRSYKLTPLGEGKVPIGQWIPVPDSPDPIWVTLDLNITAGGKLLNTLYKPPVVYLHIKTVTGGEATCRLMPDAARGGFLLSPLPLDTLTFAMIQSDRWQEFLQPLRISTMQITIDAGAGETWCYEPEYGVTFSSLQFPHANVFAVPGIIRRLRFKQWIQQVQTASGSPQVLAGDDMMQVLVAPAMCQLLLDVPPKSDLLELGFGMLRQSYLGAVKTDGVEFKVYDVRNIQVDKADVKLIWQRRLDPANVEADRGEQRVGIKISTTQPSKILLETRPGPNGVMPFSYWSDVDFHAQP
ncbi:MAG TPA: hypothetical protein VHD56_04345 [Tepidisphaeraceae bacterium]|nr:hypothetical protein [Tepidisphaeraceae bacterium]